MDLKLKMNNFAFGSVFIYLFALLFALNEEQNLDNIIEGACAELQRARLQPKNWEDLRDLLPDIFQYLNIRDLRNVEQVCPQFAGAVRAVLSKRGPELRVLPIKKVNFCASCEDLLNVRELSKMIYVSPKIAIIFINRMRFANDAVNRYATIPEELIASYLHEFPRDCTILITEGSRLVLEGSEIDVNDDRALALLIPEHEGARTHKYSLDLDYLGNDVHSTDRSVAEDYFDRLKPTLNVHDRGNPYGMLYFGSNTILKPAHRPYGQAIEQVIKQKYIENAGNFSLWGSTFYYINTPANNPLPKPHMFGMSIWGPRTKSWSLLIDTTDTEISKEEKIRNFKVKIGTINIGKSVALSMQTVGYLGLSASIIAEHRIFKRVFPGLKLMGLGQELDHPYCLDTMAEIDDDIQVSHGMGSICYMIISYSYSRN